MGQPLRFGTFIGPLHDPAQNPTLAIHRNLELIEWLDQLGYDEAWVGEHHSNGYETIPDPAMFLAAAAERTKRIRLGTGVVSLPYYHPFIVADRMVFLDHLTRGRVIMGVGPGAFPSDAHMMGLDFSESRVKMAESLEAIMRLLTADEPVSMETSWFTMREGRLNLRPYTYPHFEIAVASAVSPSGPSLAGRTGVSLLSMAGATEAGFEALRSMWSIVQEQADQCGKVVDRANWRVVGFYHLAETEAQARKDVRFGLQALMRFFASGIPFFPVSKDADWSRPDDIIDVLNDSGIAVIGTPDRMADAVRRYRDQTGGFGCFLAQNHELANREASMYSYELFMRHVAPEFQGSNDRAIGNIEWIERQDGRFIESAAAAWEQAKLRYEKEKEEEGAGLSSRR
ncbi:MAG TPA: LLM class flavin-dependent oxidoreductase [Acidimicrobiales bacterium]|jgi:limonene 1,2-monooxygenase|nr:LLM class flavin-dependent oxidoreductase [Acidimicrobiales bacterium]